MKTHPDRTEESLERPGVDSSQEAMTKCPAR
jgi:hypothetical protein